MKRDELEAVMDTFDIFDSGLLFHAYRSYMRDYELIVFNDGITAPRGIYSYIFRYCVEANTKSRISPAGWLESLDDRLTDYETYKTLWDEGIELDGYVWGVKWAENYPGWKLIKESERASYWAAEMGFDFHEILIETNAIEIRLIFSDLIVTMLSDDTHAHRESQTWLDRYENAQAPSPPWNQAPVPEEASPLASMRTVANVTVDSENGAVREGRPPRLATMPFHLLLDGEPIGLIQPFGADQGMGVVVGYFTPLPAYERVRDLFQQITSTTRSPAPEVDEEALDRLFRARDALKLTLISAGGRAVPTDWLQVSDTGAHSAEFDGYEAEFAVATPGFFDDPRYWIG